MKLISQVAKDNFDLVSEMKTITGFFMKGMEDKRMWSALLGGKEEGIERDCIMRKGLGKICWRNENELK